MHSPLTALLESTNNWSINIYIIIIIICNTTYKNLQYTTLLTPLALLTTQYYIMFSFPFTHTEREKNEKEKKTKIYYSIKDSDLEIEKGQAGLP